MRAAALAALLVACTPSSTKEAPAPPFDAAPVPPPPSTPSTPEEPAPPAVVDAGPRPTGKPVGATGKRSARASAVLASCKMPPPVDCTTDAECAMFDIATNDHPCASTLRVGIRASDRARFVGEGICPGEPAPVGAPSCVVHWDRAEDGPVTPPSGTRIDVRCVKQGTKGTCLTQYFPR